MLVLIAVSSRGGALCPAVCVRRFCDAAVASAVGLVGAPASLGDHSDGVRSGPPARLGVLVIGGGGKLQGEQM